MSFSYGLVHFKSSKQKLNTKSSTEEEVVGVSDYLPYNIWICQFMAYQGFGIKQNILFQDNQSVIKMEKDGKKSCTWNSKQINIRYFFVKDRVDGNKMSIAYCGTEHILAYFFPKYLRGYIYSWKFREVIMGWKRIDTLQMGDRPQPRSLLEMRMRSSPA